MYQSLHENRLKKRLTDRQIVRFRQKSAHLGLERAGNSPQEMTFLDPPRAQKMLGCYKEPSGNKQSWYSVKTNMPYPKQQSFQQQLRPLMYFWILLLFHVPSFSPI